jgi:hypothetical protein
MDLVIRLGRFRTDPNFPPMVGTEMATRDVDVRALIEQSRDITNLLVDVANANVLTIPEGVYQRLAEHMEQEKPSGGWTARRPRNRATLGIMLKACRIDSVMIGGPAEIAKVNVVEGSLVKGPWLTKPATDPGRLAGAD